MKRLKNVRNESGAIIIEAIIALTVYIFTIFTVLSIVDVCYTQARISIALNSAAKDLSKYSYFYYKFNLDEGQQAIKDASGNSLDMTESIINATGGFMQDVAGLASVTDYDSLRSNLDTITESGNTLSDSVNTMADSFADDPKAFMIAMGMMAADQGIEEIKSLVLAQIMGKAFMQKNLVAFEGDDPDSFLRRHGIEDGLDGLDFNGSSFMVSGQDGEIILTVRYEIKVIQLLDIEHSFTIQQTAKTTAWGNGVANEASDE